MIARFLATLGSAAFALILWADALTGDVQRQPLNVSAIVMFVAFVDATLCITYWASKRNRLATDCYAAGGHIIDFQSDLAITGDYMPAAPFLGVSALVFTFGYDGLIYSIGFLVGWPIILFPIAERLRDLSKYTFTDVASYHLEQKQIHTPSACGSLVVVAFYLIAQMVDAGRLIELLFDLNYHVAVVLMGILMVPYVLFGGMLATTWMQIIKVVLLLSGASFMTIVVLKHVNFDVSTLFSEATRIHPKGEVIMNPGGLVKGPISAFSLGFTLMFGTTGLSYILIRFFTISGAKETRKSMFYATGFTGYFCILTFVIGFDAVLLAGTNPDLRDATDALIGGNNMAAVHPVDAMGGSLLLGFISAVTFATTFAVIVGLTLAGASAVSHDLYAGVFKGGKANEKDKLRVSKMTTMALGVIAIVLGILFEEQDIAFMVGLALSITVSCNFPVLLLSMYWKELTTRGAVVSDWMGLIAAVGLMVFSPTIWIQILGHEKAICPYEYPTLFSMIVTFVDIRFFPITDRSTAADEERARFFPQFIRPQAGLGVSGAVTH